MALKHTAKATANIQLTNTLCACFTRNNSQYQQMAVVCINPSIKKSGTAYI